MFQTKMKLPPLVNSPFWPVFTVIFYPQPWKQWYVLDFSLGWWVGLLQNVLCVRNTIWKWRTFGYFLVFFCVCVCFPHSLSTPFVFSYFSAEQKTSSCDILWYLYFNAKQARINSFSFLCVLLFFFLPILGCLSLLHFLH